MGDSPAPCTRDGARSVQMDAALRQKVVLEVRSPDTHARGLESSPGSAG